MCFIFVFQIPQVLLRLKKYPQGEKTQVTSFGHVSHTYIMFLSIHVKRWSDLHLRVCVCQDFTEDVNVAFEYLLKLTPLLDKADQRCKYVPAESHNHQSSEWENTISFLNFHYNNVWNFCYTCLETMTVFVALSFIICFFVCVCSCDCLSLLLQECNKLGLLSEANTANLTAKR